MPGRTSPTKRSSYPMRTTSNSANQRRKAIRSHAGCVTCRARKVKCDERPGVCLNCERLHLECQKADGSKAIAPLSSPREVHKPQDQHIVLPIAGAKRKRTFRSCTQCRSSKARCSGHKPSCSRCTQRTIECIYDEDAAPQWTRVVQPSTLPELHNNLNAIQPDATNTSSSEPLTPTISSSNPEVKQLSVTTTPIDLPLPPTLKSGSFQQFETQRPEPIRRSSSTRLLHMEEETESLAWLFKPSLPNRQRIRMLAKEYFENIHPLRCYAFIHRPSFIQRLEESSNEDHTQNSLLHIVCALGAKFYALQYTSTLKPLAPRKILSAGNEWARHALSLLFADIKTISVQNLMAAVLLHDHELRIGNYASAFMLTGVITRMAQALQLNLEYSTDLFHDEPNNGPTVCSKEARRRLMWSCYIADTLIGSGVDQLTLFNEADMKVQLPCNERNFVLQIPCVTEMLTPGQFLPSVTPDIVPPRVIDNIGIVALYIRLISLRKQVLRYVKRLNKSKAPWLPDSEFARLDAALNTWYEQLPPSLQFTRAALYTRRESSQLGAFVLLQCTYNWTTVDLYRIALPKLYRLRLPWECADEFVARLQETIFVHAQRCSTVLADASRHGMKTLADTWLPSIAFDGNRLMLYYITQILGLDTERGRLAFAECMPYIRSNLELLESMQSLSAMAESLHHTANEMFEKASSIQTRVREGYGLDGRRTREATPDHNGPEYILQPTSVYRMARDSISVQEKHASEKSRAHRLRAQADSPASNSASMQTLGSGQTRFSHNSAKSNLGAHQNWAVNSPSAQNSIISPNYTNLLQLEPTAPAMQEFDDFFSSAGFGGSWQPAETVAENPQGSDLPAWLPAMTDMYADINFGLWSMGPDIMHEQPEPPI